MAQRPVDRDSESPLYYQLYSVLKRRIVDGVYSVGDVLPSESDMIKEFGVSRITVRRALSDLEADGYIEKRKGKGSIVMRMRLERPLTVFNSFSGDALSRGDRPGSIVLSLTREQASAHVAEKLGISPSEDVFALIRLRLLNGRIVALHKSYVRTDLGFEMAQDDFGEDTSLYAFLEGHGIVLDSADETVEARLATSELRRYLFIDEQYCAVVYKERVTYDARQVPVEFSENSYRGDQYKYSIHIVNVTGGK
ncbi:GntR family transcriptional regulator [Thermophilibacter sp.]